MTTTTARLNPTLVRQVWSVLRSPHPRCTTRATMAVSVRRQRGARSGGHFAATDTQSPEGRAMYMSCGAALLNLRVAIEHFGYGCNVHVLPDRQDSSYVATVEVGDQVTPTAMVD